ncbi:MAG TPA: hypothetical protein ENJ21_03120 [Chromatiaceae bacterium]|nr:hypothetical protein [Chromatiaceae bacterium]
MRRFLDRLVTLPMAAWITLWDIFSVLKPARFSVIVLAMGFLFFAFSSQGRDVLRLGVHDGVHVVFLYLGLLLWSLSSWYFARLMLQFHFYDVDEDTATPPPGTIRWWRESQLRGLMRMWLPRVLGASVWFVLAWSFWRAWGEPTVRNPDDDVLLWHVGFCLLGGMLLWLALSYRYRLVRRWWPNADPAALYRQHLSGFRQLPMISRWILFAALLLLTALFVVYWCAPGFAAWIGAGAVLMLAAVTWVAFGSAVVWAGHRLRAPLVTLILVLAFAFSFINDNHAVRVLDGKRFEQRISAPRHAADWWRRVPDAPLDSGDVTDGYYFIVVSEGGGIRAAYWTAALLSRLADRQPGFVSRTFAISAVSGGGLGASLFRMLQELPVDESSAAACPPGIGARQCLARRILSEDFFSPGLAYLLYPDLMQRILPVPVESFDRAAVLETRWEHAWRDVTATSRFAGSFVLPTGRVPDGLPALLLNSTEVESGKRVIASELALGDDFVDALDQFELVGRDLRVSTAIHNAARFTYFSPAGTVRKFDNADGACRDKGRKHCARAGDSIAHLVDGGYFENSGATTAARLLSIAAAKRPPARVVRPVVLMITNDPALGDGCKPPSDRHRYRQSDGFAELLAPVRTMIQARSARGSYARARLRDLVRERGGLFLQLGLSDERGPTPLGWLLSEPVRNEMDRQAAQRVERVVAVLRNPAADCR